LKRAKDTVLSQLGQVRYLVCIFVEYMLRRRAVEADDHHPTAVPLTAAVFARDSLE
jgi:hypothetical protein